MDNTRLSPYPEKGNLQPQQKQKPKNRHFGLDLFRAVAILCVVIGHGNFLLRPVVGNDFTFIPLFRGVDMFFVLSGFLIGTKFLKQMHAPQGLKGGFVKEFFRNASIRILPTYYLFLIINIIVGLYIINQAEAVKKFWLQAVFFVHNLHTPFYDFFRESWSLSITVWFYVLFALLSLLVFTLSKAKKRHIRVGMFLLVCVFLLLALGYRLYYHLNLELNNFWWGVWFRKMIPTRIDSPFLGLLAAWIRYYYPVQWSRSSIPAFIAGFAIWLFIVQSRYPVGSVFNNFVLLSISPLVYVLFLPLVMKLKTAPQWLQKIATHLSLTSFAIYLLNLLIFILIMHYHDPDASNILYLYTGYWISTLLLSSVVYYGFENPMNKFLGRKRSKNLVRINNGKANRE